MTALALAASLTFALFVQAAPVQPGEVVAEIRVHGNHLTPDAEIITIAGLTIGAPVTVDTIARARIKLNGSGKFEDVQVVKRFASIADPTKIALILIVNEGAVRVDFDEGPDGEDIAVINRRGVFNTLMYFPILNAEDGYGLTYGVTSSIANVLGDRSRLSVPLSWGGTRQAGVELVKTFVSGPITRVEVGAAIQRRTNPAFDEDDDRGRVWARAERAFSSVRVGSTLGWHTVTFGPISSEMTTVGADVTLDTRLDPAYPRNAVFATAAWERMSFTSGASLQRTNLDGRGYLGLLGQSVLAVRVLRLGANGPQPAYLKPLLGGWSSLRGFEAGAFVGDIVLVGSAELLVPILSPISVARLGLSVFVDTGVAYDFGQRVKEQVNQNGIGGSVWMSATVFRVSVSVAQGRGAGTRVNVGGGLTF